MLCQEFARSTHPALALPVHCRSRNVCFMIAQTGSVDPTVTCPTSRVHVVLLYFCQDRADQEHMA